MSGAVRWYAFPVIRGGKRSSTGFFNSVAWLSGLRSAARRSAARAQAPAGRSRAAMRMRRSALYLGGSAGSPRSRVATLHRARSASRGRLQEPESVYDLGVIACHNGKQATGHRQVLSYRPAGLASIPRAKNRIPWCAPREPYSPEPSMSRACRTVRPTRCAR